MPVRAGKAGFSGYGLPITDYLLSVFETQGFTEIVATIVIVLRQAAWRKAYAACSSRSGAHGSRQCYPQEKRTRGAQEQAEAFGYSGSLATIPFFAQFGHCSLSRSAASIHLRTTIPQDLH